ncbi:MAG TPA: DNA polymerase I, partial [Clostridia bacterium]
QLVDEHIRMLLPITRAGQTATEVFDLAAVIEKYGVEPKQLIDVKAIMGDKSDNIPGVRGIGEKGALELIARYENLDGVYASLDEIRPALSEKLAAAHDMAYLSRELAMIDRAVPIDALPDSFLRMPPDTQRLSPLLDRLGLRSIASRLSLDAVTAVPLADRPEQAQSPQREIGLASSAAEMIEHFRQSKADIAAILLSSGVLTVVDGDGSVFRQPESTAPALLEAMGSQNILTVGFDLKPDIKRIDAPWSRIRIHDILIAAYLLSQLEGKPDFARIYESSTGHRFEGGKSAAPESRQGMLFDGMDANAGTDSSSILSAAEADREIRLAEGMLETAIAQRLLLRDQGMEKLSGEIEMPLIPVLAGMEKAGFGIDRMVLAQLSGDFLQQIEVLEKDIYEMCGGAFNINSPKQLSEVLFVRLGLKGGKKNASGNFSTDADELERLADKHPAVLRILEYRQLAKLRSTFVEGLAKVVDPQDGRVHTTFNQAVTATGRLSSSEPNLQNIPIRSAVGREIRKAFVASPGHILLDADYSQIELRLLAHLSGDPAMSQAFLTGQDIHTITARKIFGLQDERVTSDMRSAAKTVNFSIAYGVSGFGLARGLGIGIANAQRYIDEYYEEYPGVKKYLDGLVAAAHARGYVETMFGRRRYIPELRSPNRNLRNFGERAAMNTPVQGTAADIMKLAMIRVADGFIRSGLQARLVLQVHDELIVETSPEEADAAAEILREGMETVASLDVPLLAEVRRGNSWFDTK